MLACPKQWIPAQAHTLVKGRLPQRKQARAKEEEMHQKRGCIKKVSAISAS
jgi:hypothetical protein